MIAKRDKNTASVFNLLELVTKSWLWPRISFFLKILPKVFRDEQGVTSPSNSSGKNYVHMFIHIYLFFLALVGKFFDGKDNRL